MELIGTWLRAIGAKIFDLEKTSSTQKPRNYFPLTSVRLKRKYSLMHTLGGVERAKSTLSATKSTKTWTRVDDIHNTENDPADPEH